jgi:hypothetical protein
MLISAVALAASATAPTKHAVTTTATADASYDKTWEALIDLFAERQWPIVTIAKDSGIITTDWLKLTKEDDSYADCGRGAPLADDFGLAVRFNVRLKSDGASSTVTVNAGFRRARSSGTVDCYSTGAVEALIHGEIAKRTKAVGIERQ